VNRFIGSSLVATTITSYTVKITVVTVVTVVTIARKVSNGCSLSRFLASRILCTTRGFSAATSSFIHLSESESEYEFESYVTTDGQPARLCWNKAPIWGLRPDLYYCLTFAGLLVWGALSDERTGPSFTIAAGPRQRSYFRVRVP
jgi:hypothetical protein